MRVINKILELFFALILTIISIFIPKRKNLWIYGSSRQLFIDNSKYFFFIGHEKLTHIRHIWITDKKQVIEQLRSLGFEAYSPNSIKGLFLMLSAKVFLYSSAITDTKYYYFDFRMYRVNLWHGIPLKQVECDVKTGPLQKIYNPKNAFEYIFFRFLRFGRTTMPTIVLCTSKNLIARFSSAFNLSANNVVRGSYPRTYPFYLSREKLSQWIKQFEGKATNDYAELFSSYSKVWMYMPTFRDTDPYFMNNAISDFKELNEIAKNNNALFVLKTHYINTVVDVDIDKFKNICFLPSNIDPYPLLPYTDVLITDYSSIFFDYLIRNKKIIFYPFDIEKYLDSNRDFYYKYEDVCKGYRADTFNELLKLLANPLQDDSIEANMESIREYFWDHPDTFSLDILYKRIHQDIGYTNEGNEIWANE